MSNYRNLSLERSKYAWESADKAERELRELDKKFGEYVILVKNLPARVSNSGLGQTLAFLKSKKKTKEKLLLESISGWLIDRGIYSNDINNPREDIIQKIQNGEVDQYRWATSETMELITWLKLHSSSLDDKNEETSQINEQDTYKDKGISAADIDDENSNNIAEKESDSKNISEINEE